MSLHEKWRELEGNRVLDTTAITLLYLSRYSLMPELYQLLGQKQFIKFVEIFGGSYLQVPSVTELKKAIRDTHIYMQLRDDPSCNLKVKELSLKHDVSMSEIRAVFEAVRAEFESIEESDLLVRSHRAKASAVEAQAIERIRDNLPDGEDEDA